jgi:hypothetical protein
MQPHLFRVALVLVAVLSTAGGLVDVFFPELLSDNYLRAIEAEPPWPALENTWVIGVAGLLALITVVGGVGLFFFKAWARPLSVWSTVASFALYPFVGNTAASWLMLALNEASFLLLGVVLTLAYYGPPRLHFEAGTVTAVPTQQPEQ